MAFEHSDAIEVRRVRGKGLGVFARRAIEPGETIERVPVLVVPTGHIGKDPDANRLAGYCFEWGQRSLGLALGYGSLYNHSYDPNARYEDAGGRTKLFVALRPIASGEEITVNYNGEPADRSPVWFDVIESTPNGHQPNGHEA